MNESHPARAFLYARVSTPGQKRRDHAQLDEPSLGQQATEMEAEAGKRGWLVVGRCEDVLSGSVPVRERPGGRVVYEQAEAGAFDLLMVYDNDRIGRDRDAVVAKVFRADMRALRKQIFSVHQPLEPKRPDEYEPYEDDSALWLESVSDTASSVFIRQFRRRSAFGMRQRVETKRLMAGKPPTGYLAERHVLPNGKVVLGRRYEDPVYGPIIRRIFNEYESGLGWRAISRGLNEEGLRTPGGCTWSITTLCGILDNPTYYGASVYYRSRCSGPPEPNHPHRRQQQRQPREQWLIVENAGHPALVTKAQWEHCQEIKRRKRNHGRTYGESTLLSGLVRCGYCGGAMYKSGNWKGGDYLCCLHWRTGGVECVRNPIRRLLLEEHVLVYLDGVAADPQLQEQLFLAPCARPEDGSAGQKSSMRQQLERLDGKLARCREAYEGGIDTLAEYARHKEELVGQQVALRARLLQVEDRIQQARRQSEIRETLATVLARFPEEFRSKPLHLQKLLLRELIDRIEIKAGDAHLVFRDDLASPDEYARVLVKIKAYSEGSPPADRAA
jgi:site-specific DNA recombinase